LHDARVDAHRGNLSERGWARDIACGIRKVRVIEEIKKLPAEKHAGLLTEFCALDDTDVHVALIRSPENIPSQVSKDCPPATHWKLSINQSAIRNERRGDKYIGIEELIDAAAHAAFPDRAVQRRARLQTPSGEKSRWPEKRTCGSIINSEGETRLERDNSRDGPSFAQPAYRHL